MNVDLKLAEGTAERAGYLGRLFDLVVHLEAVFGDAEPSFQYILATTSLYRRCTPMS